VSGLPRRGLATGGWRAVARDLTRPSRTRQIFLTTATIGGATLIVKLAAMMKDVTVAFAYGTHGSLDAFLTGFIVPLVVTGIIVSALGAAFIPAYIKTEHTSGIAAAHVLLRGILFWTIVLVSGLSVVLALFSGPLTRAVAPGFEPARLELAHRYFLLLLPTILLSAIGAVLSSALNAGHRYAAAALAPIVVPLLTAAAVLIYGSRISTDALCYGTTLGYLGQCLALGVITRAHGLPITPKATAISPEMREVFRQFAPAAAGSVVISGTTLVDQAMASSLNAGSISALSYANKVSSLIAGIVTLALGTAVLPHFSEMVARNDWSGLRRTVRSYTRLLVIATVPMVAILIVLAHPVVAVLFQRGAFDAHDAALVATTQSYYLLQVPFFAVGILLVRLISALQRNSILFWGTVISVLLNAGLDYLFMQYMGVPGIALSTSCVYAVSCAYLGFAVSRVLPRSSA
jgi:putative peptidoglycan lipid II flippase